MGHEVLHHVLKTVFWYGLVFFVSISIVRWWLESMQRRRAAAWNTHGVADMALFPAAVMAMTVLLLLATPVTNTMTRLQEQEADMYGINASRQPDGFAQAMLKLGQYRKMEPGPVEEFLFFDHPSGRNRILSAMQWKSQNFVTTTNGQGY